MELDILATIMSMDKSLISIQPFNKQTRAKLKTKYGLSSSGLSNHVKSMTKKGYLKRDDNTGLITINTLVIPNDQSQEYNLKIINGIGES